jgi:hypothetical protein
LGESAVIVWLDSEPKGGAMNVSIRTACPGDAGRLVTMIHAFANDDDRGTTRGGLR